MAEKRMFSKTIIDSDAFLDMPLSTQALYFHLSMRADDEGFINNPKKIMRVICSNQNDLDMLLMKRYLLPFESGVVVIKHWKLHNTIRKDRIKETIYIEEKQQIIEKENGVYTDHIPKLLPDDTQVAPSCTHSIDKVRLDKVSIVKKSYYGFSNVTLKEDEYKKIVDLYGEKKVKEGIEKLSNYKLSKGKKYKSDYGALNTWVWETIGAEKKVTTNTDRYNKKKLAEKDPEDYSGVSIQSGDLMKGIIKKVNHG